MQSRISYSSYEAGPAITCNPVFHTAPTRLVQPSLAIPYFIQLLRGLVQPSLAIPYFIQLPTRLVQPSLAIPYFIQLLRGWSSHHLQSRISYSSYEAGPAITCNPVFHTAPTRLVPAITCNPVFHTAPTRLVQPSLAIPYFIQLLRGWSSHHLQSPYFIQLLRGWSSHHLQSRISYSSYEAGPAITFNPVFHTAPTRLVQPSLSIPYFIQLLRGWSSHHFQSRISSLSIPYFITFNPVFHHFQSRISSLSIPYFITFNPVFHHFQSRISYREKKKGDFCGKPFSSSFFFGAHFLRTEINTVDTIRCPSSILWGARVCSQIDPKCKITVFRPQYFWMPGRWLWARGRSDTFNSEVLGPSEQNRLHYPHFPGLQVMAGPASQIGAGIR